MSRERARLRAEREQQQAAVRAKRARDADKRSARAARRRVVVDAMPRRRVRIARPVGILARRRRRRFVVTVVIAFLVQVATWAVFDSWWLRVSVALLTVLFAPAVLTLMSDRRS